MPRSLPPVGFIAPMLPTLVNAAPEGTEWVHGCWMDQPTIDRILVLVGASRIARLIREVVDGELERRERAKATHPSDKG